MGRRWGSAGGDADPGWKDTRVPGPPFSAREFIVSQFNYRTDHGICLKINFYCENKIKNSSWIAALAWSRKGVFVPVFLVEGDAVESEGFDLTLHEDAEQHRAANCLGSCIPEGIQL